VEVLPDFSNFREKSVPQITKHLGDAGDEGGRRGARNFGSSFAGGIGKVAGVVGGAIAALGIGNLIGDAVNQGFDFIKETISVASDLNESINAVNVSYGQAAESVLALGENSARMFGLSKRELNGYATQFSSFVQTISGPGGDAAHTLQELVGRASDFASVFNLEVSDALAVFQSGLAGESEPLRKFGIDLSAASVSAYAYANGIAVAGEELTEAQKVQARYGYLLQQTQKVSDDFANTSDQLANKNRINAATWDDLQAKIGEGFLPIASELATIVSEDVLPAISKLVDEHGPELTKTFQDAVPAISDFIAQILPLLPQLLEMGGEALPLIIKGGEVLIPVLAWLTEETTGWFTAVGQVFALLSGDQSVSGFISVLQTAGGTLGWLVGMASSAGASIGTFAFNVRTFATNAAAWLGSKVTEMVGFVQSLPQRAVAAISGIGDLLYNSGRSLIQGFIDGIGSMLRPVGDAVSGVLNWAMGFFPNSPADRGPLSGSGWNDLAKSGEAVMTQFTSRFGRAEMTGRLAPALGAVAPAVRSEYATSSASMFPSQVTLVDEDGSILSHARVIAGDAVSSYDATQSRNDNAGRRRVS
jgi:phage-related protein